MLISISLLREKKINFQRVFEVALGKKRTLSCDQKSSMKYLSDAIYISSFQLAEKFS